MDRFINGLKENIGFDPSTETDRLRAGPESVPAADDEDPAKIWKDLMSKPPRDASASHPHSSDDSTLLKVGLTMYTMGYIAGLQKSKELVDVGEEISQQNTQLLEDIRSLTQSSVLITPGNEVAVPDHQ